LHEVLDEPLWEPHLFAAHVHPGAKPIQCPQHLLVLAQDPHSLEDGEYALAYCLDGRIAQKVSRKHSLGLL
jgi:hypothetical protein